jgi:hypothetical protein
VRLVAGGRQVPYVPWVPPEPVLVAQALGAAPEPSDRSDTSRIAIALPATGLPLGELELVAPAAPFRRPLRAHWIVDAIDPQGEPIQRRSTAGSATWSCPGSSVLPCRLRLRLGANPSTALEIALLDGDNRPLESVDVHVWRRSDALLFAWPDADELRLVLPSPGAGPPRYDLALIADEVRARPAVAATAERIEAPPAPGPVDDQAGRLALVGALALAAVALLALLVRMLPRPESAGGES